MAVVVRRPPLFAAAALVLAACSPGTGSNVEPTASPVASAATSPAATPSATPSAIPTEASSSPAPSDSAGQPGRLADPVARATVAGQAPAAIVLDAANGTLWVYAIESGDLQAFDQDLRAAGPAIHIGGLGSHVVVASDGTVYVARFETGGSGDHLVVVTPGRDDIRGVATGPLGALAVDSNGFPLALAKADELLRIDPQALEVAGRLAFDVDDEHMEVVAVPGGAWASSDHTPLRHVALPELEIDATVDIGGGVPFALRDGLVWGARADTLWAIDAETGEGRRRIALPGVIEVLALDIEGDDAWLAVRQTGVVGMVLRLDLATEAIVGAYPVDLPAAVRIVADRVFVASYTTNEVLAFARS